MDRPVEITLEQLLRSRDERYARQLAWTGKNPESVLVCLTVILPGAVKRDRRSLRVAEAGVAAVREWFQPVAEDCLDLDTGFEGYFLVKGDLLEVKRSCCRIEDSHPLGRLMDLDVLERTEDTVVPVSRERVGEPSRRCLLCDRPARECMRAHTHSREDLLKKN